MKLKYILITVLLFAVIFSLFSVVEAQTKAALESQIRADILRLTAQLGQAQYDEAQALVRTNAVGSSVATGTNTTCQTTANCASYNCFTTPCPKIECIGGTCRPVYRCTSASDCKTPNVASANTCDNGLCTFRQKTCDSTQKCVTSTSSTFLGNNQCGIDTDCTLVNPSNVAPMIFPNGGETITPGQTYNIRWNPGSSTSKVDILMNDYSWGNQGLDTRFIASSIPNSGSFTWTPGKITSGPSGVNGGSQFKIGVRRAKSGGVIALSANNFTVSPAPAPCQPSWQCGCFSSCSYGVATRKCVDLNNCPAPLEYPFSFVFKKDQTTPCIGSGPVISPWTHKTCKGGTCVAVSDTEWKAGAYLRACEANNACGGGLYQTGAWTKVFSDTCGITNPVIPPTTHKICQNQQCVSVTGAGTSTCSQPSDCVTPTVTHFACQAQKCVIAQGAGANTCYKDLDCVTTVVTQKSWLPIAGDWNNNTIQTIGLYNPATSTFHLRNTNTQGVADITFGFGTANAGWLPIAGDWNGDGTDTVGLYDPASSHFYLKNSNTQGASDISFGFGTPNTHLLPIAGDWDRNGTDTVGVYDPASSHFYLKNSNTQGVSDINFGFGAPGAGLKPIAGTWLVDGGSTVGLYDPYESKFYLRTSNTQGSADITFLFGTSRAGWLPIAGSWNGGISTIGLYDPASSHFYLKNSNTTGLSDIDFGYGVTTTACTTNWQCSAWSACTNSAQTRTCTDSNNCGTTANRPLLSQSCSSITCAGEGQIYYPTGPSSTEFTGCCAGLTFTPSATCFGAGCGGTCVRVITPTTQPIYNRATWIPVAGKWNTYNGKDTIGLYNKQTGGFALRNSNTTGLSEISVPYNTPSVIAGALPIAGAWGYTSSVATGIYSPATSYFYERETNVWYSQVHSFMFGTPGANLLPVAGDWNADQKDGIGVYNPATSTFLLRDANIGGVLNGDYTFSFGTPNAGWLPIAGDWDGNGRETVGLYDPASSHFYLRNSNTTGMSDIDFGFGTANGSLMPIAGDWDGDGTDTVGLYDESTETFYLKNANTQGGADLTFKYGPSTITPPVIPVVLPTDRSIAVTYPNGDETLVIGQTYDITWSTTGYSPDSWIGVDICYANSACSSIITMTPNNGSYSWTVPEFTGTSDPMDFNRMYLDQRDKNYKIKLTILPEGSSTWDKTDMSDGPFLIANATAYNPYNSQTASIASVIKKIQDLINQLYK